MGLGYGCSVVPSKGKIFFLPFAQLETGSRKGSYHTAWSFPCDSSFTCSYAYWRGFAIGPQTGKRCWPLLARVWRAIAPLMKPWCAEGELPTAANLNLYRGWNSCVGWHCDDEPLFGENGEAKLIVSVSLGSTVLFRWRRQSCPDDEGHLCCLGHGDILMDGRCQDKFLHRTDPCREQERINITFRWVKQHVSSCPLFRTGVACCLPTCAQGLSVPVMGNSGNGILGAFWLLFCVLCAWEVLVLLVLLLRTRLGLLWCASCWTRLFGVVRRVHYLCNHWRECEATHKIACFYFFFLEEEDEGRSAQNCTIAQPAHVRNKSVRSGADPSVPSKASAGEATREHANALLQEMAIIRDHLRRHARNAEQEKLRAPELPRVFQ